MTSMDIHQILDYLPHRYPILLVDRVLDMVPGERITALKNVTINEEYFSGHYPGQPIMPAVLLIEAVAQVAGIAAQTYPQLGALPNLRLTAVRNTKIFRAALPGESLDISVEISGRLGNLIQAAGRISSNGNPVAESQIVLSGG